MDGQRFDEIARGWANGVSRRKMVKGIAAGVVAAALAMVGLGETEAKARCRGGGKICRKNGDCCGNACLFDSVTGRKHCNCPDNAALCGGTCCGKEETCQNGQCQAVCDSECCADTDCATGNTCCKGTCVNLLIDSGHCGTCSTICGSGTSCCGGVCVDLQTDRANCKACGNDCGFYSNTNLRNCCVSGNCLDFSTCGS